MQVELNQIEKAYADQLQELLDNGLSLQADSLVDLSGQLFEGISVEGISAADDADHDMLLFQYGVYDWGDELGEHFSLDITRQFLTPEDYEPYQLRFTLIYAPEAFRGMKSYNCWSTDCKSIEDFAAYVKTTEGFVLANEKTPLSYKLAFSQC